MPIDTIYNVICEYLFVAPNHKKIAKNLEIVQEDIHLRECGTLDAELLVGVDGAIFIYTKAIMNAPALKSVKRSIVLRKSSTLNAIALSDVNGDIFFQKRGGKIFAPSLVCVSGNIYLSKGSTLFAPKLVSDRIFEEIETDGVYPLFRSKTGLYAAGCMGPFTAEQALLHWGSAGRSDYRAVLYTKKIKEIEGIA